MAFFKHSSRNSLVAIALLFSLSPLFSIPTYAETPRNIVFPVIGPASYSNGFNSPRANGPHHATDIFGVKGQPLVAAVDGTISYVTYPQASWGYAVFIKDNEGFEYRYIHMNNDTPGTDDGNGGPMFAFAPDIQKGNRVVRGQHIGYLGDSGNAETTPPHLHFEIGRPDDSPVDPFYSLNAAQRISQAVAPPALEDEILPYGQNAVIGIKITYGNFDADPELEFATSAGAGGGPHVKVYDHDEKFTGLEFMAYDPRFSGGIDVASGDVDGDGIDEIITGAGAGGGPHVRAFKSSGTIVADFMAYDPGFTGGVNVASGDVDGDGIDEIITGAGAGGGPDVSVFRGLTGQRIISFYAYDSKFTGGFRVSSSNMSGSSEAEIATVPSRPPGGPNSRIFNSDGTVIKNGSFMEPWWEGYPDIAIHSGKDKISSGINRRATVRKAFP